MHTILIPFPAANATGRATTSSWSVRQLARDDLDGDPVLAALPGWPLEVLGFGLIEHRCDRLLARKSVKPRETLKLKLAAGQLREVALVVDLPQAPNPKAGATALFAVEEIRADGQGGGVVVAVGGKAPVFKPIPLAPRPSPLRIVGGPRFQKEPHHIKARATPTIERTAGPGHLGVLVRNAGKETLLDVRFYTECIAIPGARFEPRLFTIGKLEPGATFFASFPLDVATAAPGPSDVTYVAYDADHDPTRVRIAIEVVEALKVSDPGDRPRG